MSLLVSGAHDYSLHRWEGVRPSEGRARVEVEAEGGWMEGSEMGEVRGGGGGRVVRGSGSSGV